MAAILPRSGGPGPRRSPNAVRESPWRAARVGAFAAWAVVIWAAAGCGGANTINSRHGQFSSARSVNGLDVLADLYEQRGFKPRRITRLSPQLEKFDVLVWAPDDFEPPSPEARAFLEKWLDNGWNRVVVYIGRDFDSAPRYWRAVRAGAPPEQALEIDRRLARALAKQSIDRAGLPANQDAGWFLLKTDAPPREVRELDDPPAEARGAEPWRARPPRLAEVWRRDIDPARLEIELASRLEPPPAEAGRLKCEPLLTSRGEHLVFLLRRDDANMSKVVVAANGSFWLNLPLVNAEHRKLAGKLIDLCGAPRKVAFLESGPGGPPVSETDVSDELPAGFELFYLWPFNALLLAVCVFGVMLCFVLFPIFGRPHTLPRETRSDMSRHVAALGDLLARSGGQAHARQRWERYQTRQKREPGKKTAAQRR